MKFGAISANCANIVNSSILEPHFKIDERN